MFQPSLKYPATRGDAETILSSASTMKMARAIWLPMRINSPYRSLNVGEVPKPSNAPLRMMIAIMVNSNAGASTSL